MANKPINERSQDILNILEKAKTSLKTAQSEGVSASIGSFIEPLTQKVGEKNVAVELLNMLKRRFDQNEVFSLDEIIQNIEEPTRQTILALAIPKSFNQEIIQVLTGDRQITPDEILKILTKSNLPIKEDKGKEVYHFSDEVRTAILEIYLTQYGTEEFGTVNQTLSHYFEKTDDNSESLSADWLYHQLIVDYCFISSVGFEKLQAQLQGAEANRRLTWDYYLLSVTDEVSNLIISIRDHFEPPRELFTHNQKAWIAYFYAVLDMEAERWQKAEKKLYEIFQKVVEDELISRLILALGLAHLRLGQYRESAGLLLAGLGDEEKHLVFPAQNKIPPGLTLSSSIYGKITRAIDIAQARLLVGDICMAMGDPDGIIYRRYLSTQSEQTDSIALPNLSQNRLREFALEEFDLGISKLFDEKELSKYFGGSEFNIDQIEEKWKSEEVTADQEALVRIYLTLKERKADADLSLRDFKTKHWNEAARLFTNVIEAAKKLDFQLIQAEALLNRGICFLGRGLEIADKGNKKDYRLLIERAQKDYDDGFDLLVEYGSSSDIAKAYLRIGDFYATQMITQNKLKKTENDYWREAFFGYQESLRLLLQVGSYIRYGTVQKRLRTLSERVSYLPKVEIKISENEVKTISPSEEINEFLMMEPFRVYSYPASHQIITSLKRGYFTLDKIRGALYGALFAVSFLLPINKLLDTLATAFSATPWLIKLSFVILLVTIGSLLKPILKRMWPSGYVWFWLALLGLIPGSEIIRIFSGGHPSGILVTLGVMSVIGAYIGESFSELRIERNLPQYIKSNQNLLDYLSLQPDYILTDETGITNHSFEKNAETIKQIDWNEIWSIRLFEGPRSDKGISTEKREVILRIIPFRNQGESLAIHSSLGEGFAQLQEEIAHFSNQKINKLESNINSSLLQSFAGCLVILMPPLCLSFYLAINSSGIWQNIAQYIIWILLFFTGTFFLQSIYQKLRRYLHLHPLRPFIPENDLHE